jgi:3-hydroxyisobutyrate dehydrogenase-like beta-hydroxyacid dehydrogenase
MIGVIGVGDMGLPMAGHILARGFESSPTTSTLATEAPPLPGADA